MAVPALLRVTHFPEMAAELLQGTAELLSIAANKQKNKKKASCWCCAGEQGASSEGFEELDPACFWRI